MFNEIITCAAAFNAPYFSPCPLKEIVAADSKRQDIPVRQAVVGGSPTGVVLASTFDPNSILLETYYPAK